MATPGTIRIEGARQNNLQNLTFDLPLGMFHVLTATCAGRKSGTSFLSSWARANEARSAK